MAKCFSLLAFSVSSRSRGYGKFMFCVAGIFSVKSQNVGATANVLQYVKNCVSALLSAADSNLHGPTKPNTEMPEVEVQLLG